jgi:hypothetical protein
LAFDGIGEIDFLVGHAMTDTPTTKQTVEGEQVDLETVAEIVTKKIHYRGASIKARDIFDIAAAATHDREAIVAALKAYRDDAAHALATIERLNPDFVNSTIAQLAMKSSYKPIARTALEDTKTLLNSI